MTSYFLVLAVQAFFGAVEIREAGQVHSLWSIWLRWRAAGEWDTRWGDNTAVSMQRVLLLNVNAKVDPIDPPSVGNDSIADPAEPRKRA